jgi:hypothetical protein
VLNTDPSDSGITAQVQLPVKASAARAAAADWVERHAAVEPGFVGAYFSGSVVYLPDGAEVPVGSDVDVMVVSRVQETPERAKFMHRGTLIEATRLPWSLFASLDTVPSAHSLRLDSIVADPGGELARVQAVVAAEFAKPGRVRERSRRLWDETEHAMRALDRSASWPGQVMGWAFRTSWTALLVLVAAVRNPTVRLRYLAAREVLAEHRLSGLYPELLDLLGCRNLTSARAARHLDELARTFDAAARVARTRFAFSSDVTPIARPVAIEGTLEQIRQGNHREMVFWLLATFTRCHMILAADAPDLDRDRGPAFDALLADLGIRSPADLDVRAGAVIAFLPRLWEAAEQIIRPSA